MPQPIQPPARGLRSKCGKGQSNKGRRFDEQSLEQHERDCWCCQLIAQGKECYERPAPGITVLPEELGLEMAELLAGDESDGVFWGIAYEQGEWF